MIREDEFRALMSGVCSTVTIVTTMSEGAPRGATVSAFASLSLSPPMISIALDQRSQLLRAILRCRRFAVNVLCAGQDELAMKFAQSDTDRFSDRAWELDDELPRLLGAGGFVACDVTDTVSGGDHVMIFGRVTAMQTSSAPPLIYARRMFGTHSGLVSEVAKQPDRPPAQRIPVTQEKT